MLTQQNISHVVVGMDVLDKDGTKIGTVKSFRLGEGTIKTNETDIVTIATSITESLGKKDLPTVLYSRLYDEGFICIKRGFLRSDMIIFPKQVDDIGNNEVNLNVSQDDLLKA